MGCVRSLYCRLGAGRMRASTSTKRWSMFICHACTGRLQRRHALCISTKPDACTEYAAMHYERDERQGCPGQEHAV
jgi:hypothetical protein